MGGFTLIEMMVVVAILAIIAAATFAGFRQDEYRGQYKRFVDDMQGAIITARDRAIDDSALVRITFDSTSATITEFNEATNVWDLVDIKGLRAQTGGDDLLLNGNQACIYGLTSGVQTPAQAENVDPPDACLAGTQILQFEPDGRAVDPDDAFTTVDFAGYTLWIADRQVDGNTQLSIIQLFPGGLVRTFEKTSTTP